MVNSRIRTPFYIFFLNPVYVAARSRKFKCVTIFFEVYILVTTYLLVISSMCLLSAVSEWLVLVGEAYFHSSEQQRKTEESKF